MEEIIDEKLSSLSELSKAQFEKILCSVPNAKDLTIEPSLIRPLECICGVSWLKSHGVEKIYKLDTTASAKKPNNQVFIIYTNTIIFQKVLQQIQSQIDVNIPAINKYHIVCVPKTLYLFDTLVEGNGLWNIVKLYSFQWFPIQIDEGLLSLEIPAMFKNIFIQEDFTLLPAYAKSLWHLFMIFGKPDFCLSVGSHSQNILKQLEEMLDKLKIDKCDMGGLIVIDRNVDYASALLTPSSYSALLNEVYEVKCGVCREEKPLKEESSKNIDEQGNKLLIKQPVNFVLDSKKDTVYKLIKDKHFLEVTDCLRQLTRDLKLQGETSDMALNEMKRYVQTKLHSVAHKKQLVTCHLNATETLVNYLHNQLQKLMEVESNILHNQCKTKNFTILEEYLQSECDASSALALFLLLSITQKVTDSEVKSFMTKFFIEFGYNSGQLYRKLIKANLIENVSNYKLKLQLLNKGTFFVNANKLKQIHADPEKINSKDPNCYSYVYSGLYIPLIAQIVSLVLSGTLIEDLKQKLHGFGDINIHGQYQNSKRNLFIYIVGGMTYSEIAALNLLESLMGVRIIKISDKIISKRDIVQAFIET